MYRFFLLGQNANVVGLTVMSLINRSDLINTKVRNLHTFFQTRKLGINPGHGQCGQTQERPPHSLPNGKPGYPA